MSLKCGLFFLFMSLTSVMMPADFFCIPHNTIIIINKIHMFKQFSDSSRLQSDLYNAEGDFPFKYLDNLSNVVWLSFSSIRITIVIIPEKSLTDKGSTL